MLPVEIILPLGMLVAFAWGRRLALGRPALSHLRAVADRLNFWEENPFAARAGYQGAIDGFEVLLRPTRISLDRWDYARYADLPRVPEEGMVLGAISIRVRLVAPAPRAWCFQFARTPDELVVGSEVAAAAFVSARILEGLARGDRLELGEREIQLLAIGRRSDADLEAAVRAAVALAREVSDRTRTLVDRLHRNATDDPDTKVRAVAAEALIREHRADPRTREVIDAALLDPEPEVRFAVARSLGPAGFDTIEQIAGSSDAENEVRVRALLLLARSFPRERALPVLLRSFAVASPAARYAILGEFGRLRAAEVVPALVEVQPSVGGELARRLAETLGEIGDPRGEPALIEMLDDAPTSSRVEAAAADALGRIGTRTALPALFLRLSRGVDAELKVAIETAIEIIRGRLAGAEAGSLAIVHAPEAGALSLPVVEAGSLSPAEEERSA